MQLMSSHTSEIQIILYYALVSDKFLHIAPHSYVKSRVALSRRTLVNNSARPRNASALLQFHTRGKYIRMRHIVSVL